VVADTGVYVYAIVRDVADVDLDGQAGIGDRALRPVEGPGVIAVASDVDLDEFGEEALRRNLEELTWLEAVARRHDEVARHLASQTATAPLRLATVFRGDESVRRQLADWADAALAALDRIDGRSEWSVKAYLDVTPGEDTSSRPATDQPGAGAAYLAQRRAALGQHARAAEEQAALGSTIHERLESVAVAGRRLLPQDRKLSGHTGEMVLNGSYLVEDASSDAFVAAAERAATENESVRVEVGGPWPPYSFATLEDQ
jgi:hypothetical protein